MKKAALAVLSGLVLSLLVAAPAFAQSEVTPPDVGGSVVTPPGGTAFTGSSVTVWMILAVALFVVGATFVALSRRRARSTAH